MKQSLNTVSILARLRKKSAPRFVVLVALLGFLFQSHVAQTHIHVDCAQVDVAERCTVPGSDSSQSGSTENPGTCALCQIAAHGGAAPLPAVALTLAAPEPASFSPADQVPLGAVAAVSHSWQSRAPPAG